VPCRKRIGYRRSPYMQASRAISAGIGRAITVKADGVQIVEVKTLDPSAGYAPYDATRAFWLARGFIQLDTIDPLPGWPPGNPAAILAVALAPTR